MRKDLVMQSVLVLLIWMYAVLPTAVNGQQLKELQFTNQPIADILVALGEISGKSIVPDQTVTGFASYYFSETDFETALQIFLDTYGLYWRRQNNVYYVSKIKTVYDPLSNSITLDAESVDIDLIVQAASAAMGKTVLFDPLPPQPLTVHVAQVTPKKLLEILVKKFPDYQVDVDADYFYIRSISRIPTVAEEAPTASAIQVQVERKEDRYSIRIDKGRFRETIEELFQKAGLEYSLLMGRDQVIEKLGFENKSFDHVLRLVLEQASADYTRVGDIYYIFEIQQRDILKKLKSTVRVPLTYVSAKDLTSLFPADLAASKLYKIDTKNNAVLLNGSLEEIGPVQDFIKTIDRPLVDQRYFRFNLKYLDPRQVQALLPPAFRHLEPIIIPETNSFIALLPPANKVPFEDYIKLIDKPPETAVVELKYIKAEVLLQNLPPSVSEDEIVETRDPSIVFLRTSPEKMESFYREIEILDRPVPQVRYQLLVIQYNESEGLNWANSFEASLAKAGSRTAFLGKVGQLLSLNFDVISIFGYQFALKLNTDLSTSKARILADTTLNGISGQQIRFQNTETFRYREVEIDEEGNRIYTGITREITAGLIFDIAGWVSGDGMITMGVKATVSKRGTDVSLTSGSLPPTSENVIDTQVRTFSGEPVVIGGLIRQEVGSTVSRVPLLGDIPVLGYLFQSRKETAESTELVVYILPHVDYADLEEQNINLRLERIYHRFF
jgi:type II secretory pathway component GspD/PulD (secretin)